MLAATGAAVAVAGGVVALLVNQAGVEPPPRRPVPAYTVPNGILELELGMTLEQAKASGADVAAGRPDTVSQGSALGRAEEDPSPRLTGAFWAFSTTIAGQVARCQLEFAVDDTLSRIGCSFAPFSTVAGFNGSVDSIKSQLRERYQLPAGVCGRIQRPEVVIGDQSAVRCRWAGDDATLSLSGHFEDTKLLQGQQTSFDLAGMMRTSVLRLSLESSKHTQLVEQQRKREADETQRRLEAAASDRRAREAAERRRIEEAASRGL